MKQKPRSYLERVKKRIRIKKSGCGQRPAGHAFFTLCLGFITFIYYIYYILPVVIADVYIVESSINTAMLA